LDGLLVKIAHFVKIAGKTKVAENGTPVCSKRFRKSPGILNLGSNNHAAAAFLYSTGHDRTTGL
jgi:hypothetical protein